MFLKSLHKQSWYVVFYFFTNLHTNHRAFSAKNCATPVEDIDLLEVDLPGLSIKFTVTPLKFSIFLHRPPAPAGNPCFFLNFWFTPLEFQWLLLYVSGTFHWYPQQGGYIFFPEKPIWSHFRTSLFCRITVHQLS